MALHAPSRLTDLVIPNAGTDSPIITLSPTERMAKSYRILAPDALTGTVNIKVALRAGATAAQHASVGTIAADGTLFIDGACRSMMAISSGAEGAERTFEVQGNYEL